MTRSYVLVLLVSLPLFSLAQASKVALQTYSNSGGATGTITSGIPTHFSVVGQPTVLARPTNTSSGGGVMAANEFMFTVIDESAPVIAHTRPAPTNQNTSLPITATVTDVESSVTSVVLSYRTIPSATNLRIDLPMTAGTNNTWSANIPAEAVTDLGIDYVIKATNGAALEATSAAYQVSIQTGSAGLPISTMLPIGKNQNNYRIIAIPLMLAQATVNGVFADELGNQADEKWRMYHYESSSPPKKLNGNSPVVPGLGYWFLSAEQPNTSFSTGQGTTVAATVDSPFEITIAAGWNQIGNPYTFDVSWADIVSANPNLASGLGNRKPKGFNGSPVDLTTLKKFEGGFIMFEGTPSERLKVPVKKSTGGRVSHSNRNPLGSENWEVRLSISNGILKNELGGFGMNQQASEGADGWDDYNMPHFFDYLEVVHSRIQSHTTQMMDMVPPGARQTWDFKIETNQPGSALTLEWDNSYFGSSSDNLWLTNLETGEVWDMRKHTRALVEFKEVADWRVAFGDVSFVEAATQPEKDVFQQAFPNPFQHELNVRFALVESGWVQIDLFDVNGRMIKQPLHQYLPRGRHAIQIKTEDSEVISQGIYVLRMISPQGIQFKRLVKH